jgi:ecotin
MQVIATVMLMLVSLVASAGDNLKAFPAAGDGMTRHVLVLPARDDEALWQVELIVGKQVEVDAHNRFFLGGSIQAENVSGWGYTLYRVAEIGPLAGTLMAVDPAEPKVTRFVPLGGEPYLVRYNSGLPVVVYVPRGAEVRYRLWLAEPESHAVPQG